MTRARETLTVMRAEGGRNPYLVDVGTVEGVVDLLPAVRPEVRAELNRRYLTVGPAEMDIRFAGRLDPSDGAYRHIAAMVPGDEVTLDGRYGRSAQGHMVGRMASKTEQSWTGIPYENVSGILVRTRAQTQAAYLGNVRTEQWEVVLVEILL